LQWCGTKELGTYPHPFPTTRTKSSEPVNSRACLFVSLIDWSQSQIIKLPASEKATSLFDGSSLHGWKGQTEKYFTVKDGIIIARNDEKNALKASTYLVTEKSYRNFRLIFEAKLVTSEMHSGIALWGKNVEKESDPFNMRSMDTQLQTGQTQNQSFMKQVRSGFNCTSTRLLKNSISAASF